MATRTRWSNAREGGNLQCWRRTSADREVCCFVQASPLIHLEICGHFSQKAISAEGNSPASFIRLSIMQWRRLIEPFDQAGPVFKPPLTARADRQMSRPSGE
jgi:hypothetical protein